METITAIRKWVSGRERKEQRLLSAAAALVFLVLLETPSPVRAAGLVGDQPNELSDLEPIVQNIISVSVALAGVALFAMLVLGSVMYLSSGGSPERMQKAKNTLTYGIIGIALMVLAWFILLFIQTFTGVQVTVFEFPNPNY